MGPYHTTRVEGTGRTWPIEDGLPPSQVLLVPALPRGYCLQGIRDWNFLDSQSWGSLCSA